MTNSESMTKKSHQKFWRMKSDFFCLKVGNIIPDSSTFWKYGEIWNRGIASLA